tara:strand:+ start:2509 stop:2766 length:258 start_codon:yes stop_codon:yes gene_type:complete
MKVRMLDTYVLISNTAKVPAYHKKDRVYDIPESTASNFIELGYAVLEEEEEPKPKKTRKKSKGKVDPSPVDPPVVSEDVEGGDGV